MYICTHICIYVHIYICIHTHTYIYIVTNTLVTYLSVLVDRPLPAALISPDTMPVLMEHAKYHALTFKIYTHENLPYFLYCKMPWIVNPYIG